MELVPGVPRALLGAAVVTGGWQEWEEAGSELETVGL